MNEIDYIKKFSVKIKYHEFQGTGVLVRSNNDFYIITAKHNFKESSEETHADVKIDLLEKNINDIEITIENDVTFFSVDQILFFQKSLDLIIFSVKNISFYFENIDSIKIFKGEHYNNNYFLYGYPNDKSGRALSLSYSHEINNNEFRLAGDKSIRGKYLTGFSGSGLFVKENNTYYLVGILIKGEDGLFNYEAINISNLADEIASISSIQYKYDKEKNKTSNRKKIENETVSVHFNNYSIDVFRKLVTFKEFDEFCSCYNKIKPTGVPYEAERNKYPVVNITYVDAIKYCEWLCNKNKKTYRLASSEEWDSILQMNEISRKNSDDYIWHAGNSQKKIQPVANKKAGKLGIYDMYGNVNEWCNDKIIRGGSVNQQRDNILNNKNNAPLSQNHKNSKLGFRVVIKK